MTIRAIVEEELAAHRGGDRSAIVGPSLRLRPEAVQPLSMVLHELATNAAKYGALSVPGGRLEVSWRRDPPAGPLRLRWQEHDGPPAPRRGFGSTLIERRCAASSVAKRRPTSPLPGCAAG
ncbi:hypothetical protein JMJ56_18260 [Belnapia sp. T18]|uniref:histidine kinase n=1 Tax=Belnapia arida TaxID=2804533 RepID=A0ABS1U5P0_9PROT|nr:hypothetical protein [Belnapia arida]MBL6079968.1 hypothetical protein [Belnapia arida]